MSKDKQQKKRIEEIRYRLKIDVEINPEDIVWLISEVERLQAVNKEFESAVVKEAKIKGYLTHKVERLEKALVQIAGISDTNPYRESELMRIVAKDALRESE